MNFIIGWQNCYICLSGDPPVESVVPFTAHADIITACVQMQANNYNAQLLDALRKHCVEIVKLLHYSWSNGTLQTVTKFIQHLVELVIEVHANDLHPVSTSNQCLEHTDPPNGVAYYFSPNGEQLRKLPKAIKLQKQSKTANFDDNPLVDNTDAQRTYPGVSHGLLWLHVCVFLSNSWPFIWVPFNQWI